MSASTPIVARAASQRRMNHSTASVIPIPTAAAPINRSDIYICGSWTNFSNGGEPPEGCEAPIVIGGSGAQTETVFHSLAIEFPDPLPPPVSVTVRANPLASAQQPVVIGTPGVGTVDCQ